MALARHQLRGIGLFTGEPGGGKTTVCRAARALFEPSAAEGVVFRPPAGLHRQINRIAHYALSATALDDARTSAIELSYDQVETE